MRYLDMDVNIKVLISEEEIQNRVKEIAAQISADYEGESVHLICILKGSLFFTADLARRMTVPVTFDFMSLESYGERMVSSGKVKLTKDTEGDIGGKNVIVIEDIVDTGRTLSFLMDLLKSRNPKSLKLCTFLNKPERRVTEVEVDYVGFNIPDRFVVGYGMDYAQKYRELPYIGYIE